MEEKYITGYQDGEKHYNFVDSDAQEKLIKLNKKLKRNNQTLTETVEESLKSMQPVFVGTENAGKTLIVDENGNLVVSNYKPAENTFEVEVDF